MQGKTHYIGGTVGVMVGYIFLEKQGMLIQDINPVLQASIMYPFGIHGGQLPDIDHHKGAIPFHDPVNIVINRVIHIPNRIQKSRVYQSLVKTNSLFDRFFNALCCKHRSWQTHGDLVLYALIYFCYMLMKSDTTNTSVRLLTLVLLGEIFGILSHFILDLLTSDGIVLVIPYFLRIMFPKAFKWLPKKISLVPKTKKGTFATGSNWELYNRELLKVISYWLLFYILLGWFGISLQSVY